MLRSLRWSAVLTTLVVIVGACTGAPSPTPGATPPPGATPTPVVTPSGLTGSLTIWHAYGSSGGSAEFRAFTRLRDKLLAANPDLQVEALDVPFDQIFTKFETESAAGGGPDMFIAPNDNLGSEVRGTFLADLTGKIDDVLANTNDVSISGSKVGDAPFMVPESLKAVAMYYDADKVATPPTTTDELLALVQAGGKLGVLSGPYFGWGFYYAFGGRIFDDTGKCAATANTGVADALKFVADLKAGGALVDSDYGKVNDAFKNGDVDIIFNGNWTLGDYKAARPALGVAAVPSGPGGVASTMVGVDGWYINVASQNQDLAIAVATWMTSQESQEVEVDVAGHVPANKNIEILDPLVNAFSAAINQGVARPQIVEMNNYWGNFDNAWNEVLQKGTDPATAVATACQAMDTANKK